MCCWAILEANVSRVVLGGRHAGIGRKDIGSYSVETLFKLTGRSFELDAVLLAGCPAPAPDAAPSLDAKAGAPTGSPTLDPRIALLLQEAWRHAKSIGAWGDGTSALEAAGIPDDGAGVVLGEDAGTVSDEVLTLLSGHRVWDRFSPVA